MQDIKEEIIAAGLPEHIAIIMDGNGRWAEQRGLDRVYGHKQGVDTVKWGNRFEIPYFIYLFYRKLESS